MENVAILRQARPNAQQIKRSTWPRDGFRSNASKIVCVSCMVSL
jgi:hypothetical protein